jgi:hypothetical protein
VRHCSLYHHQICCNYSSFTEACDEIAQLVMQITRSNNLICVYPHPSPTLLTSGMFSEETTRIISTRCMSRDQVAATLSFRLEIHLHVNATHACTTALARTRYEGFGRHISASGCHVDSSSSSMRLPSCTECCSSVRRRGGRRRRRSLEG